ncbi:hypothetical protein D9M68_608000 [compost metagenome]
MKIVASVGIAAASVFLFASCSETGSSQTPKSGGPAVHEVVKAQPTPQPKLNRKQRGAAEAETKALNEARSPRQCKTPKQTCGYGVGPVGEQCSCWSSEGAPYVGVTIK